MAAEDKVFKINDKEYVVTIKQLKVRDKFMAQGFIAEIILPIMGGMMDERIKDQDDVFSDNQSMFKKMFQHVAEKLGDERLWNLFEKMIVGATYKDNSSIGSPMPLNLEEFTEHKDGIVTMNELLMFCLEVNFSSLFTDGGILQSLTGKTLDLLTTA